MCESISIPKGQGLGPILVEFQRDASMRLTEIVIINTGRDGQERQGMKVICKDNGDIKGGLNLIEGVDIIGAAEMRG